HPQKNRLFVVGDPKQSIYQFRGADISLFQKMVQKIRKENGEILYLRDNFRAAPSLIVPINRFFAPHFSPEDFQKMIPRQEELPNAGIKILSLPEFKYSEERRTEEAGQMAQVIKGLRDQGREYRDMVCLFRTRTAIPLCENILKEHQIPCHAVSRGPLFEAQEVLDLINLLKAIVHPKDLISRVGVLRSPLFAISDEEIFLKIQAGDPLPEAPFFEEMRLMNRKMGAVSFLYHLLGLPLMGRLFRFPQEIVNIEKTIALAESFEALGVKTIPEFLKTVEALREAGSRISEASLFAPTANCVRLMTIHATKGLEFPIVFLTDLNYKPSAESRFFLFDAEEGLGFKYLSEKSEGLKDHFEKSPFYEKLETQKKKKDKEESLRLLYVAMTRAKERLYLPLTFPSQEEGKKRTGGSWNDLLVRFFSEKDYENRAS
ncbi:MAG: 3'-5' exonuclease, partial [bacterium]|nr:3'-5' exonuclease [bacterium]